MKTTLDRFGRVVIPKEVRDDLGLKPGSVLQIEESKREILLKPVCEGPRIVVKDGVLVFLGTKAGDIDEAIRAHREKRMSDIITLAKK
ncbi:MAG: AbrB/MazE/SpoVT family DNA-binding domain-containing protein [Candidatus Scalindua sp.]